ncbi:MAG: hypothetical protein ACRCWB_11680 [Enterovibrio sp.]
MKEITVVYDESGAALCVRCGDVSYPLVSAKRNDIEHIWGGLGGMVLVTPAMKEKAAIVNRDGTSNHSYKLECAGGEIVNVTLNEFISLKEASK